MTLVGSVAASLSRASVGHLLLAAVVAGCASRDSAPSDSGVARGPGDAARQFAVTVDRARVNLTRREWSTRMGVDSVKLSGFAAGDTLRLIREVVDRGARGRVASRYYYAGTQLRYYESEGDVVHVGADKSMTKRKVRLVLAFNEQSAAVEATHTIDGQSAPLDTALTGAVAARATELARQWAMERTTTPR